MASLTALQCAQNCLHQFVALPPCGPVCTQPELFLLIASCIVGRNQLATLLSLPCGSRMPCCWLCSGAAVDHLLAQRLACLRWPSTSTACPHQGRLLREPSGLPCMCRWPSCALPKAVCPPSCSPDDPAEQSSCSYWARPAEFAGGHAVPSAVQLAQMGAAPLPSCRWLSCVITSAACQRGTPTRWLS